MTCQRCGHINEDGNRYCEKCGRKLGDELTLEELELLDLSEKNEKMIEELQAMGKKKNKTSVLKSTLISLVVALVLAIFCFACLFGVEMLNNTMVQ